MVSKTLVCVAVSVALAASLEAFATPPAMAIAPPAGATAKPGATGMAANAATAAPDVAAVTGRSAAATASTAPPSAAATGLANAAPGAQQPTAASAAAPASGVAAATAYNLPMGAVTIRTLAQAQARELEADARRRLGVALGGTVASAASSQSAASAPTEGTAAKVLRIRVPEAEKPAPVPYKLVGVVGRVGEVVAEIREPSGRVSVVRPGQRLGNWVVLAISPNRVDLAWSGRVTKKAPAKPNQTVALGGAFL